MMRLTFLRLAGLLLACLAVACASSSERPANSRTDFRFAAWPGPMLRVFAVEPDGLAADAPVVIVMHGVGRNADEYRDNWVDLAEHYGLRVYVPEFSKQDFPGAEHYNLGGIGTGKPRAYGAIEPLFRYVQDKRGVTAPSYVIFGHSAGAQYVRRFVCFAEPEHMAFAISANAGWYTLPSTDEAWPYGLGGIPEGECTPKAWLQQPVLVMLGDKDIDPADPSLRHTPEADRQGPYRMARGLYFMDVAAAEAAALDVPLAWQVRTVPGVAHDNRGMALAAAPLIASLGQETDTTGEDAQ